MHRMTIYITVASKNTKVIFNSNELAYILFPSVLHVHVLRQLIFLRKSDCLGCAVLLCLVVCLTLLDFSSFLLSILINPRRACAVRVTVLGLCVCLSVYDYSRTTAYEAAYERYQQLQCYKGKKTNVAILLKRLHSRDMA